GGASGRLELQVDALLAEVALLQRHVDRRRGQHLRVGHPHDLERAARRSHGRCRARRGGSATRRAGGRRRASTTSGGRFGGRRGGAGRLAAREHQEQPKRYPEDRQRTGGTTRHGGLHGTSIGTSWEERGARLQHAWEGWHRGGGASRDAPPVPRDLEREGKPEAEGAEPRRYTGAPLGEVSLMERSVALRQRGQIATLLNSLQQTARQGWGARRPDPRNLRTWRQFILGVWVARSTRLLTVARVIAPQRRVSRVKAAAAALGYFLDTAQLPLRPWSTAVLEASWRALDPSVVTTYRGRPLLVIDPTEYAKRSRGHGKRTRQMEHIGRVRRPTKGPKLSRRKAAAPQGAARTPAPVRSVRVATTSGYVDVWAGLVLQGKQFFPVGRLLYSNRHPQLRSQNRVEEAVLGGAVAL